jgi:micrococcal nuclease
LQKQWRLLIFCILTTSSAFAWDDFAEAQFKIPFGKHDPIYTVRHVIAGDTLMLSDGERVRLIGIDCPAEDKQATEYTRKLVEGKKIRLEFDAGLKDEKGRLWAYVFILTDKLAQSKVNPPDDYVIMTSREFQEIFLNATLLRAGYARVRTVSPNEKYKDLFLKNERKRARPDFQMGLTR